MVESPVDPLLVDALQKIVMGIQLLGDGVTILIQLLLAAVGLQIPATVVRIVAVIMVILFIWKLSNVLSKLWIYALVFLLISMCAGLIPAVGDLLPVFGGGV